MISLVIIVKNDPAVEDTLLALSRLHKPAKTETIVVDGSEGKLNAIRSRFPGVKWIPFKAPDDLKVSIPHQRNVGMDAALGEVIVFIDASCKPVKNWLDTLYSRYKSGEQIVAGAVIPSDPEVINNISRVTAAKTNYIDECPTANVLISRNVIEITGKFDENFEYGSDTDYMWRARKKGFKIFFDPTAIVTHDWGNSKQQLKRSFNYGKGRMRVYLKHKMSMLIMIQKDPILFFYPIFIIGLPIAVIFPYYFLLLLVPLLKNWKTKPIQVTFQNTIYGFGGLVTLISFYSSKSKK